MSFAFMSLGHLANAVLSKFISCAADFILELNQVLLFMRTVFSLSIRLVMGTQAGPVSFYSDIDV